MMVGLTTKKAPLAYIRRGTSEMAAELVVVREGVQVVVDLSEDDLERLARQALAVLPGPPRGGTCP